MDTYFNDPEEKDALRARATKSKLRVTFPDGKVVCYRKAVETFAETIRLAGAERVAALGLEVRHQPLLSRERIAMFGDSVVPMDGGWFLVTQSDTTQKHHQLVSISDQLGLDLKVEVAAEFPSYDKTRQVNPRKAKEPLAVIFPDGEVISEETPRDTYLKAIVKIGPERLAQKGLDCLGRQIVTRFQKYSNQQEVAPRQWVTVYADTKSKVKVLEFIKSRLHLEYIVTGKVSEEIPAPVFPSVAVQPAPPEENRTTPPEAPFRDTVFSDEDFEG